VKLRLLDRSIAHSGELDWAAFIEARLIGRWAALEVPPNGSWHSEVTTDWVDDLHEALQLGQRRFGDVVHMIGRSW
jgi:hypothetical protein